LPTLKDGVFALPGLPLRQTDPPGPKGSARDIFEQSKGNRWCTTSRQNAMNFAALAPRFKVFETVAGRTASMHCYPRTNRRRKPAYRTQQWVYADIAALPRTMPGESLPAEPSS